MKLFELFKQTYEWDLVSSSDQETLYKFETEEGKMYEVAIGPIARGVNAKLGVPHSTRILAFDFILVNAEGGASYENVGGIKNPYKVFATVLEILETFVKRRNPKYLAFSAAPGKQKLYTRMARTLAQKYGFTSREISLFGTDGWLLTREKQ